MPRLMIESDGDLADAAQSYLADPGDETETAVLDALNETLEALHHYTLVDAFVEPGCVEHGVVHVFASDSTCYEIEPATGLTFKLEV